MLLIWLSNCREPSYRFSSHDDPKLFVFAVGKADSVCVVANMIVSQFPTNSI
jgi:hypothetical protein